MRPPRKFGMVFCNFCHNFWSQNCCWTETSIAGNDFFVFYKFTLRSTILLPPAVPLLQHPWFHIFEHWTADVNKKILILLVQIIKKMWHCSKKVGADGMRP